MAISTVMFLAFPVAFIWFADDVAPTTGVFMHHRRVSRISPAFFVKLFGFVILLSPVVAALVYR